MSPKTATARKTTPKPKSVAPKKPVRRPPASKKDDVIREMARVIYEAVQDTKAQKPLVLDLTKKATFADYLLIASGTSDRQLSAMADRIEDIVKKKFNRRPLGIEGREGGTWVLIDYGDIVCHLFNEEARSFYRVEDLWHDAKPVKFRAKKA